MPVTDLQRYFFDLNGFIRLPGALSPAELADANARIDSLPAMPPGGWHGHVHREVFEPSRGIAYQQVYEMGGTFERMIDHPSWIEHVRHFIGGQDTFDAWYGGEFIDECFVSLRGPGEAIGLHSGNGHSKRITYRVHNGRFACMQVNVLVALDRIGPGDGATMVIPGSHKANFPHPEFDTYRIAPDQANSCDGAPGAVEVHLEPGEAIVFTDAIAHGSARRINAGQRRIVVYRYSPAFTFFRFGYRPSAELLARLTPERRALVWPFKPVLTPPA